MTLYSIVLFLHVAAVLVLFATLSFEFLSLSHLRHALDLGDVRRWVDPVPGFPLMAMSSILVILVSGVYLAVRMTVFALAWPKVTIVALLLIAPFGALTGKRMRIIRRSSAEGTTVPPELLKRLQDPFLRISLSLRTTLFLGIVLLMAAKPELWRSVAIVVCSAFLSLLLPWLTTHRSGVLPVGGELRG